MKKLLSIYSFWICLFLVANIYANPSNEQYYPQQYPCPDQCIGRCQDPCVGQCHQSCWGGRFYVGAFGGANWLNFHHLGNDFKPKMKIGYAAALSLGYKFNNGFRVEGEVSYRRNQMKDREFADSFESCKLSGSTYSWAYMANFLYDLDCVSCYLPNIVPYVGVGVGYTHIGAHVKLRHDDGHISDKGKDNGIAGQAIAGISYRLTDETSLGLEYRYFVAREHARDHSVGLALRQSF
jgi:outer membrane autotransporter protein